MEGNLYLHIWFESRWGVSEEGGRGREVSCRWWWLWRRRRRLPHLWPGSSGEGHGGRRREWERGARCTYAGMCTLPSPPPAFLGKGKLSVAIIFILALWSPPYMWCFMVGQTVIWGVYLHWKMCCSLYFNHGRSVGFPSLQCRSRAALTRKPQCDGSVYIAVREASGNFTCRFKSIIMTHNLKIWNCQKWLLSSMRLWHAELDMK